MTSQKSCVFEIINKLNNKIVELDSASGREKLREYIIPDDNGRTDNVFVRRSPLSASLLIHFLIRHNPLSSQISSDEFFWSAGKASVSKSAISQKRTRLSADIFTSLCTDMCREYYRRMPHAGRWLGWHIMAVDGSEFMLPDTDALAEVYGRVAYTTPNGRKGESFPMAKCVMFSDVLTGLTLLANLFPYLDDDRRCFLEMLPDICRLYPELADSSITVFDRGFFSALLMYRMVCCGMKFVIRAPMSSPRIRAFAESGMAEACVDWMPVPSTSLYDDAEWRAEGCKPLRLRLVRVELPGGEVEVLVTNLTSAMVGASKMKGLYFKRWGIEVDLLHYKHVYEIEAFSGARPLCVEQDFRAVVLAHNIICMTADSAAADVRADNRRRMHDYKTNIAVLAGVFYLLYVNMFVMNDMRGGMNILWTVARKRLTPILEGRSYSRVRKRYKSSDRNRPRTNRKRVL